MCNWSLHVRAVNVSFSTAIASLFEMVMSKLLAASSYKTVGYHSLPDSDNVVKARLRTRFSELPADSQSGPDFILLDI
jgi:hypothetical protein